MVRFGMVPIFLTKTDNETISVMLLKNRKNLFILLKTFQLDICAEFKLSKN
jgi:hypothetical protein